MTKIREYHYQAKIMPGVYFPVRTTLLDLGGGRLAVISPGPGLFAEARELLKDASEVLVISPNVMHYAHVVNLLEKLPRARYFAPKGVDKKCPDLKLRREDMELLRIELTGDLACYCIDGNSFIDEWVFYVEESGTLIVTDLCFHMNHKKNFMTNLLLKMVGASDKVGQSKLVKKTITDREAYLKSITTLRNLAINSIIVGHGEVIEHAGIEYFWKTVTDI